MKVIFCCEPVLSVFLCSCIDCFLFPYIPERSFSLTFLLSIANKGYYQQRQISSFNVLHGNKVVIKEETDTKEETIQYIADVHPKAHKENETARKCKQVRTRRSGGAKMNQFLSCPLFRHSPFLFCSPLPTSSHFLLARNSFSPSLA